MDATESSANVSFSVDHVAGIWRRGGVEQAFGSALDTSALPTREVRRFGYLERALIACLKGLPEGEATPIIYGSRYGGIELTRALLRDIWQGETLSPNAFSMSVHNAPVGVASKMTQNRGAHNAIAAGPDTLNALLLECASMLHDGASSVILAYADCQLREEYEAFADYQDDLHFALVLSPNSAPSDASVIVQNDAWPAASLARDLETALAAQTEIVLECRF